ncbi:YegS/Rv2252/BmrU family lipid kinase [Scopulibacillus daqui]|uniref:YegS/Rv2252/BmrU family lipid kinase n=1 Tax=Scopulibacillus daqui TaxID=1469162 RepID=A0ABS2PVT7_9BACL|nr:diacylglycerol kinase family protein [Scopulibacillus daqui]MBM7643825.1 YegS/Rv2252/BmrU family lipid kinase [Scopulibacillus daqui]
MDKVSVIVNPNAGQKKIKNHLDSIKNILSDGFKQVSFYETRKKGDGTSYAKKLANSSDVIIAAGGDGTVYEVLNGLSPLNDRPAFAIIPGGTCNDFSRALGMSQNPAKAAEQIVQQNIQDIDVGFDGCQYFLNFWGIGLITAVSSQIEEDIKSTFGRLSYYLSTIQNIKENDTFHYEISSSDYYYSGKAEMIIIANGPFTGGIKPFLPEVNIQDGMLDVLVLREANLSSLFSILKKRTGMLASIDENIIHFQTPQLTLKTSPKKLIDCDGERHLKTPAEATIRALPNHLKMLAGKF